MGSLSFDLLFRTLNKIIFASYLATCLAHRPSSILLISVSFLLDACNGVESIDCTVKSSLDKYVGF